MRITGPRRSFALPSLLALLALPALGCGSNPAVVLKRTGEVCASNMVCSSNLCMNGKCTRLCGALKDCPVGFNCGLAVAADKQTTCYKPSYDPGLKGGLGTDCSLVAADPKSPDNPCSDGASPCASGLSCLAARKCDPGAYCTGVCKTDVDCPPTMFCGISPADKTNLVCLKRTHCSPCVIDDQCAGPQPGATGGVGWICASDPSGERYCAKICKTDDNCPQPANDESGPAGDPFQRCQMDKGHADKACKPSSGYCHGPSAVKSVSAKDSICSGCRVGFPGDCGAGLICYNDDFTTERFCTRKSSVTIKFAAGRWTAVPGTDSCNDVSPDVKCLFGANPPCSKSSKSPCTLNGSICSGDPTITTCYPSP